MGKSLVKYAQINLTVLSCVAYPQGCTTGKHNSVKPPEPEKKVEKPLGKDEVGHVSICDSYHV